MIVVPGDEVGTAEEFVPGPGIFSDKDHLYSLRVGVLEKDMQARSEQVIAKTRVPRLQGVGTVAFGVVAKVTEQVALIDLAPVKARGIEAVPTYISAIMHVSDMKQAYVDKAQDELRTGDIVKVRITDVSPHTIRLSMSAPGLGVVKAFCSKCRHVMTPAAGRVSCPRCGSVETRKLAIKGGDVRGSSFEGRPQERTGVRRQRR